MLNCDKPDVEEMIECLKVLPVAELTSSAGNYSVKNIFTSLKLRFNLIKRFFNLSLLNISRSEKKYLHTYILHSKFWQ